MADDRGSYASVGCGCAVLGILALGCCGGVYWWYPKDKDEGGNAEVQADLNKFSKEQIPELHTAIDLIEKEIADRKSRCSKLEYELKRLGRQPRVGDLDDPDLKRWRSVVADLEHHLRELKKQREDAYLAYKKFELAPKNEKAEYDRIRQKAQDAGAASQAYHKQMQQRLEGN
jgi:hypothetical protein